MYELYVYSCAHDVHQLGQLIVILEQKTRLIHVWNFLLQKFDRTKIVEINAYGS